MKRKILFRADGNSSTGLGHLYRLFSLVEMLKDAYDIVFLTSESSTIKVIPQTYNIKTIPQEVTLNEEPQWLEENFSSENHMIIADGYQFSSKYQKALKQRGFKLAYIDDLAQEYMFADIVVNHSPQFKKNHFKAMGYTKFALGTDYALLRPNFLKEAKKEKTFTKIDIVFVNFGGADKFNLSLKYAKVLLKIQQIKQINIVLGAAADFKKIQKLKEKHPKRINIYSNLSEIELISIMKLCNFAIAPCSTILFELFCVKMPIYSGYFANNQKNTFFSFKERKLVGGEGNLKYITQKKLYTNLLRFIKSGNHINAMKAQHKIIDGKQKKRYLELFSHHLIWKAKT